jgi:hypothetical protein
MKILILDAGSPGQYGAVAKGVGLAGIGAFVSLSSDQVALAAENNFVMGNPLNAFGATAAYARAKGDKKAGILVIDVPSATGRPSSSSRRSSRTPAPPSPRRRTSAPTPRSTRCTRPW